MPFKDILHIYAWEVEDGGDAFIREKKGERTIGCFPSSSSLIVCWWIKNCATKKIIINEQIQNHEDGYI